ncbi:pro-sigmaK processing inhibitor BofA [Neobacillus notoginsengisoli]|uniref:Pro-sigmaK processing inhibitor BofA n=1 Tax=Neobacillus notoginsengisoli TaxID=1578198 RepID=A0A417YE86_9BACI|nr:pro-sigmaK processing inhibitor BofA family protein [Neobacillus notoginsengisoli]RHW30921.1 pro-sigmaK processing inhibitor BofA [Neobacillus notoginsengisoli]
MEPIYVISIIGGLIIILLVAGAPMKTGRMLGQAVIKLIIGAVLLFFLNTIGNQYGVHIPINLFTTTVSGFLGIPGLAALVAVDMFIIG